MSYRSLLAPLMLLASNTLAVSATREDLIVMVGNDAGKQTVATAVDGSVRAEYSYNDRGRGDHIVATWKLDADGIPIDYRGHGNDAMKSEVEETFHVIKGSASWKNRSEHGEQSSSGKAFYIPLNAPPEFNAVLARALLRAPDHKLALLPSGEARIEEAGKITLNDDAHTQLMQYRISGLNFSPLPIWLTADGRAISVSSWFSVLPRALRGELPKLQAAQDKSDEAWAARIAHELTHIPGADLIIRNARLFDPRDLSVTSGSSVLIRGERIVRVAADADMKPAADAEIIDAGGRFLMPGLWDNHQHFSDNDGALDLMGGVTTGRDLANDTEGFLARVAHYDDGSELGPRVLKAGIIEGVGELAGPTKMRVETPEQAIKDVDWYADHGYVQIKIYSSVKPELMPIIADRAHARGLRVSGHVPAFMSARQFVEGGADEIQHFNFIVLNFLFDTVKETRNRDRFIKVAEHAREFGPDNPRVQEFIVFLKQHHTVLDPTMGIFESLFAGDPSDISPAMKKIAPRLPQQVRRGLPHIAMAVPKGQEVAYREAFPAMQRLLKAMYDAGVTIIPGTDEPAGYTLHHELELYVDAGIPAPEVLRMATLTSARVMGVDFDRGTIVAGKHADLILIDGDPSVHIADIENIHTVIKGGKVYDPARIAQALGIAPRAP